MMINKRELLFLAINLFLSMSLLGLYYLCQPKPRPIATIDIKAITDEFLTLATRAHLPEAQMTSLVSEFTSSLESEIITLSHDYLLLNQRAVISDEIDLTGEMRDYIAARITNRVVK